NEEATDTRFAEERRHKCATNSGMAGCSAAEREANVNVNTRTNATTRRGLGADLSVGATGEVR
ncbi:MAG: hypothetical protein WAO98_11060, partial [Alphaproteobacteria bacterium]